MVWEARDARLLNVVLRRWLPDTEEAMSASSRMGKAISEESWTALAKEKERDLWSIDFGGEVEELEVGGPWTSTKGNSMDSEREVCHQPDGEKAAVEEGESVEILTRHVMEVGMEVHGIEKNEKKVIRGESEEPQDYVCEMLSVSPGRSGGARICAECHERAARSHLLLRQSVQRKAIRYWQFASMVVEEGWRSSNSEFASAVLSRVAVAASVNRG